MLDYSGKKGNIQTVSFLSGVSKEREREREGAITAGVFGYHADIKGAVTDTSMSG